MRFLFAGELMICESVREGRSSRVKLSGVRSALYYPFTSIQSEKLIRTSLLLSDRVHVMVPWKGFGHTYSDRDHARALELIGVEHVPTKEEQKQAHEIVEDFEHVLYGGGWVGPS